MCSRDEIMELDSTAPACDQTASGQASLSIASTTTNRISLTGRLSVIAARLAEAEAQAAEIAECQKITDSTAGWSQSWLASALDPEVYMRSQLRAMGQTTGGMHFTCMLLL
ncbi:unnamed protein product [Protopolystoma xenopodis]|uniref:Uncharacterized protein n=1 Tax=Protopolystoma xenopodis TaxID=117903 RepID=A0A448X7K3_9PLAT|nr:unnamed protein product [Protopolystoma xenopodis]